MLPNIPYEFKYWRMHQKENIEAIIDHILNGKRIIVLNAPTGAGKSLYNIATISALLSLNPNVCAYILTSTKMLQEQYVDEFPNLKLIKGRENYPCTYWDQLYKSGAKRQKNENKQKTCKDCYAAEKKEKCKIKSSCAYQCAKNEAIGATIACMNMAYFISALPHPETGFNRRTICVIDEAHYIENTLMSHYNKDITKKGIEKLGNDLKTSRTLLFPKNRWDGKVSVNEYFKNVINYIVDTAFDYVVECEKIGMGSLRGTTAYQDSGNLFTRESLEKTKIELKVGMENNISSLERMNRLNSYHESFSVSNFPFLSESEIVQYLDSISKPRKNLENCISVLKKLAYIEDLQIKGMLNSKWIATHQEIPSKGRKKELIGIVLKPLDVKELKNEMFSHADHYILSSATLSKQHMKDLGFEEDDYELVTVPAAFPIKNRPLKIISEFNQSYKNLNDPASFKQVCDKLDKILDYHSTERGIIHVSSKKLMKQIYETSRHRNRIIMTTSKGNLLEGIESNESAMKYHLKKNNGILISPSLHTGADFRDEKARFQIIFNMPFMATDEQVDARRKQDINWYLGKAVTQMIQSYGRTTRSMDDWSVTYILDSRSEGYLKNDNFTPSWVKEAVEIYDSVDSALTFKNSGHT
jgi:Rad3-related DNA helicase